jgi:hypothetical protein
MVILSLSNPSSMVAKTTQEEPQPKLEQKNKLRAQWNVIDGKLVCQWFSSPD